VFRGLKFNFDLNDDPPGAYVIVDLLKLPYLYSGV